MAKLADAADLKSAGPKGLWGFDSPSRHQLADYRRLLYMCRRERNVSFRRGDASAGMKMRESTMRAGAWLFLDVRLELQKASDWDATFRPRAMPRRSRPYSDHDASQRRGLRRHGAGAFRSPEFSSHPAPRTRARG